MRALIIVCVFLVAAAGCMDEPERERRSLAWEGEACVYADDCASSLVCTNVYGEFQCQPPGALKHMECNERLDCPVNHLCNTSSHKCVPIPPPTPKAGPKHEAWDCYHNTDCPGIQVCNWGYSPYKCTDKQDWGGICGHDNECIGNLYCTAYKKTGACAGMCYEDSDCPYNCYCASSTSEHPCRKKKSLGASCLEDRECRSGTYCNEGHRCWADDDCELNSIECGEGMTCAPFTMDRVPFTEYIYLCTERRGVGELCATSDDCRSRLWCEVPLSGALGNCREMYQPGERCETSEGCQPGQTCNFAFSPWICAPPGEEGEPCHYDDDCEAGMLCDYQSINFYSLYTSENGICVSEDSDQLGPHDCSTLQGLIHSGMSG